MIFSWMKLSYLFAPDQCNHFSSSCNSPQSHPAPLHRICSLSEVTHPQDWHPYCLLTICILRYWLLQTALDWESKDPTTKVISPFWATVASSYPEKQVGGE